MTKRLFFILASAALLYASPFAFAETVIAPAKFGHHNAQGIPVSMDDYALASTGTGFFVSLEGHFVTPFHVAGHCKRLAILRPERAYEAIAAAMNPALDIAIFKSDAPHVAAELVPAFGLHKDTAFTIVRFAHLGGFASHTSVIAHYLGRAAHDPITIAARASATIVGGNSGSPMVLPEGGVVGMVTAASRNGDNLVFGIDSATIARALQTGSVPFRWQVKKLAPGAASGRAIEYTYSVACYVAPAGTERN